MHKNRGKQQKGKDGRFLQENWKYQGNISPKMGTIKDRSGRNLADVDEIKTRYLQENWKYQGTISPKDGHNKGEKQQRPSRC